MLNKICAKSPLATEFTCLLCEGLIFIKLHKKNDFLHNLTHPSLHTEIIHLNSSFFLFILKDFWNRCIVCSAVDSSLRKALPLPLFSFLFIFLVQRLCSQVVGSFCLTCNTYNDSTEVTSKQPYVRDCTCKGQIFTKMVHTLTLHACRVSLNPK